MAIKIITDSTCDLPRDYIDKADIDICPLKYQFGGETDFHPDIRGQVDLHGMYDRMRAGTPTKTSMVNADELERAFLRRLDEGFDILYLAFSSGLSGTYQNAMIAADNVREKRPGCKLAVVDTLCASAGEGLIVHLAVESLKADPNQELSHLAAYIEERKLHVNHWFTVDDLHFLKRGGRVSAAVAIIGSLLSIKPVLHVDDAGHLIPVEKVKGRKRSLKDLVDRMENMCIDPKHSPVFISHGDCSDDADYVNELIKERFGRAADLITFIGPVIGAHSGPGTVALFFVGKTREDY